MKSKPRFWTRAQGLVEFALILPVLLLLILGVIEMGRLLAIYSGISSGARQAVRYGSVAGDSDPATSGTQAYYLDCSGIRDTARRASPLITLADSDIAVAYDHGTLPTFKNCPVDAGGNNTWVEVGTKVTSGDRVVVAVSTVYRPLVPIVPIPPLPLTFQAARSIFTSIIGPTPTPVCPAGSTTTASNSYSTITSTTTMTVAFTSAITVTAKNEKICPMLSPYTINLSSSGPATPSITASGSPAGTVNGSGVVSFVISTTVAGTYNFTATGNGLSKSISIIYMPDAVNAGTSTVVASPATIASDGLSASTVTVTLKDQYSNAVGSGKTVSLDDYPAQAGTNLDCGVFDPCKITALGGNDVTNASGQVIFKVRSGDPGLTELQAIDSTDSLVITQRPVVTYTAGAISAANSTVIAQTTVLTADNVSTTRIIVTLRDGNNNLITTGSPIIPNVLLTSDRGSSVDTISPAVATDVNSVTGQVTFTVRSNTVGVSTYTATVADNYGSMALDDPSDQPTITYIPSSVNAGTSTVTASPTSVQADGVSISTITVTLRDINSQPVSGKTVTLTSSRGITDTITTVSGVTNASGQATFTVKSNIQGTSNYTATDTTDGIGGIGTAPANQVTFTSAGASATLSTFVASPASVQADGADSSILVVTLKDSNGTPLAGKPVTIVSSRPLSDTITAMNATTNASGQATFTVVSTSMGTSTYTATSTSDSPPVVLAQQPTVDFVCVTGSAAPNATTSDQFMQLDFANATGITRRLYSIVITWPNSPATRLIQSLELQNSPIWNGSSNVSPITISDTSTPAWGAGNRTLNNGFTKTLKITFNFAVPASGTYTITAIWDNTADGSLCTTPTIVHVPS